MIPGRFSTSRMRTPLSPPFALRREWPASMFSTMRSSTSRMVRNFTFVGLRRGYFVGQAEHVFKDYEKAKGEFAETLFDTFAAGSEPELPREAQGPRPGVEQPRTLVLAGCQLERRRQHRESECRGKRRV